MSNSSEAQNTTTTINHKEHFQILEISERSETFRYRHYTNGDKTQEVRMVQQRVDRTSTSDGISETSSVDTVSTTSTRHQQYFNVHDSIQVPQSSVGKLIGKKGATRSRMEKRFHVHLKIPSRDESRDGEDITIRISAASQKEIDNVKREISRVVEGSSSEDKGSERNARPKRTQPPTHFLSIPLNDENTQAYFQTITARVQQELQNNNHDYARDLYQTPIRAHMTLQVLHLLNEEAVQVANDIFSAVDLKSYGFYDHEHAPHIRFGSLGAFSKKSAETSFVVYLEVEDSPFRDSIIRMANDLREKFMRAELIQDMKDLQLHVTFMNVKFSSNKRLFNAKPVMEAYEKVRLEMTKEGLDHRIMLQSLDLSKMKSKSRQHYYEFEQQKFFVQEQS